MELNSAALPRTSPEKNGVSSARILQTLRELDANENEVHGVMIAVNGNVISESWPKPFSPAYPHTNHSLGKSWTCTAVGIACQKGLMSPDDLLVDHVVEELKLYGIEPEDALRSVKLRDVMSMSCGMTAMPHFDDCWMENFLRFPITEKPGTYFCYNSVGSCILGALVEKLSGKTLYQFLKDELFGKIGVGEGDLVWRHFGNGICAEPGTSSTTEANLRLGLFYLAKGFASGEQIVSEKWMTEATRKQVETTNDPGTEDGKMGYGWQLWMCQKPHVFRFDGGQGQFCLVDTEKNAVIALHEGGVHPHGVQKTLDILEALLRDLGSEELPENSEAQAALRDYENSRSLPSPEMKPIPANAADMDGSYAVREGHANFWMEAFPGNVEFYHMFYDASIARDIQFIDLRMEGNHLKVTVNQRSVFKVALDGVLEAHETYQVMPDLPMTCCHGYFEDEKTVQFTVHWLNSWMAYDVTLRRDGADLTITVAKTMRHEGKPPVVQTAVARRIGS